MVCITKPPEGERKRGIERRDGRKKAGDADPEPHARVYVCSGVMRARGETEREKEREIDSGAAPAAVDWWLYIYTLWGGVLYRCVCMCMRRGERKSGRAAAAAAAAAVRVFKLRRGE